jgi:hypothetical protein
MSTNESDDHPRRWASQLRVKLRGALPTVSYSPDELRQLDDRLRVYQIELEDLCNTIDKSKIDQKYAEYSREQLLQAKKALDSGNVESFWRSVSAAKRWEILALSQLEEVSKSDKHTDSTRGLDPLQVRAQNILIEATDMLSGQSSDRIEDLLGDGDGTVGSPETIDILAATQFLYNGLIKEYRATKRYRILKRQLGYFILIGLAGIMGVLLLWKPVYASDTSYLQMEQVRCVLHEAIYVEGLDGICFLPMIFFFGVLGATTSSILSLSRGLRGTSVPEQVGTLGLTVGRVTVGGISALVIFVFLIAGIIDVVTVTPGTAFAFAFVGGFTERLLTRAVESIAGTAQSEEKSVWDQKQLDNE